jgi:uncharacterized OB-fold protein
MTSPEVRRIARENARLIGYRCRSCGWISFPERKRVCKGCRAAPAEFQEIHLKPYGRVLSYVVQYRLPEGFQTPLPLAVVELDDGLRVYGHLIECVPDEIEVGMGVEAELRVMYEENGERVYSYKFRPRRATPP